MQQGTENQKYDTTTSFLDNAEEATLDAQGRFTVNQRLKEAAVLTNESTVVFKGKGKVIEIWNTDEYEKIYNSYDHSQGIYDLMDKVKGNAE
jgi:DNA-binding transcriptional regulator/RsmH inhibitor MraZ